MSRSAASKALSISVGMKTLPSAEMCSFKAFHKHDLVSCTPDDRVMLSTRIVPSAGCRTKGHAKNAQSRCEGFGLFWEPYPHVLCGCCATHRIRGRLEGDQRKVVVGCLCVVGLQQHTTINWGLCPGMRRNIHRQGQLWTCRQTSWQGLPHTGSF